MLLRGNWENRRQQAMEQCGKGSCNIWKCVGLEEVCGHRELMLSTQTGCSLSSSKIPMACYLLFYFFYSNPLFFSSLFSHLVPDKRDTWTLTSSLFIPSCSEFQSLPCMVPRVKLFALPPSPVFPT